MASPLVGRVEIGKCAKTLDVSEDGRIGVDVASMPDVTIDSVTNPVTVSPVAISSMPNVTISSMPDVVVSSLPSVTVSGGTIAVSEVTDPVATYPGASTWESAQFTMTTSSATVVAADADTLDVTITVLSGTVYLAIDAAASSGDSVPLVGPCILHVGSCSGEINMVGDAGGEVVGVIWKRKA